MFVCFVVFSCFFLYHPSKNTIHISKSGNEFGNDFAEVLRTPVLKVLWSCLHGSLRNTSFCNVGGPEDRMVPLASQSVFRSFSNGFEWSYQNNFTKVLEMSRKFPRMFLRHIREKSWKCLGNCWVPRKCPRNCWEMFLDMSRTIPEHFGANFHGIPEHVQQKSRNPLVVL